MILDFNHFRQAAVRRGACYPQSVLDQDIFEVNINFITVPVPFTDLFLSVGRIGMGVPVQNAGIGPQPHRRPFLRQMPLFWQQVDDGIGRVRVELGAVGFVHPADVPGVFHHGHLHAEADPEVGNAVFPGVPDGGNHAFAPAVAEPAGDENSAHVIELILESFFLDLLGIDETQVNPAVVGDAAVHERLVEAFIGISQIDVLAHNGDAYLPDGVRHFFHHILPSFEVGPARPDIQEIHDFLIETFPVENERDFIDASHVLGGEDGCDLDVAEQ